MSYSLSASSASFMPAELKERMSYFDSLIHTETKEHLEHLELMTTNELFSNIKTKYHKICNQINQSEKSTEIWVASIEKNTFVYIMDMFLSHYKESIIKSNDSELLELVIQHLNKALKSRLWAQKFRYLREAASQFVNTTIKYTGFSALVKFDYKEGDMTSLDTMDVYDMFNVVSDVVSILCVNDQTYLIQTLQPKKVNEICNQINGKNLLVKTNDITGTFKLTTTGFKTYSPVVEEYNWREQKNKKIVMVATNKKIEKYDVSDIIRANKNYRNS